MARLRRTLNGLSLVVIFTAAPQVLEAKGAQLNPGLVVAAGDTTEGGAVGGTCCSRYGSTCYLNMGNGILVVQSSAYAC